LRARVRHWYSETAVEARDIVMGMRVSHSSNGARTILSGKPIRQGAELLVRFNTGGEKWIVFGLRVLEFADSGGAWDESS
jgi:hypothetical protein